MERNGNSKSFLQSFEHVKHCSVNGNATKNSNIEEETHDQLFDSQRQTPNIQEIMSRIPKPGNSFPEMNTTPQPHEIYQNLGPLMGSGLQTLPTLPPKVKDNQPPLLPPRVSKRPLSSTPSLPLSSGQKTPGYGNFDCGVYVVSCVIVNMLNKNITCS